MASCTGTTDGNTLSHGRITGPDYRRCANPCCGGWFIEIGGKTWRFLELPPGNDLDLNSLDMSDFPIDVTLYWRVSDFQHQYGCADGLITVDAIRKR